MTRIKLIVASVQNILLILNWQKEMIDIADCEMEYVMPEEPPKMFRIYADPNAPLEAPALIYSSEIVKVKQ